MLLFYVVVGVILVRGSRSYGAPPGNRINNMKEASNILSAHLRIYGGNETSIYEHPFMVQVYRKEKNRRVLCGGTLIDRFHILTAGHCVTSETGELSKDVRVRMGTSRLSSGGVEQKICSIFRHPNFKTLSNKKNGAAFFDLAVLKLKKQVTFSDIIYPVMLATKRDTDKLERMARTHTSCSVLGWGLYRSDKDDFLSDRLLTTYVEMIHWAECRAMAPLLDMESELCCISHCQASACKGDSGGPLMCDDKQYGLVSRGVGSGCGVPERPYIYTRIDTLYDFILSVQQTNY